MKISIITPNYNYAKFLPSSIESILNQDYDNLEYIIVDDGSTDESVSIIRQYENHYPDKIKFILQSNYGQTSALNKALKAVSGDIICWLNSDDMFCENVFTKVINIFKKYPLVEVVFGDIYVVNQSGEQIKLIKYLPFDYLSGIFNGFGKIIPSNGIFWKSNLSKETGLMDERFHYAMDSEYWSRILYKRKIVHIPIPIAKFRYHENAKTIKRSKKNSKDFLLASAEDKLIRHRSYSKLLISHFIPITLAFPLKLYYKLKRHFLKLIQRHYF